MLPAAGSASLCSAGQGLPASLDLGALLANHGMQALGASVLTPAVHGPAA